MRAGVLVLSLALAGCGLPRGGSAVTKPSGYTPPQASEFCANHPEFVKCRPSTPKAD